MAKTKSISLPNGYICPRDGTRKFSITVREVGGPDEDFLNTEAEHTAKNMTARFLARVVTELGGEEDPEYIREVCAGALANPRENKVASKSVFTLADYPTALILTRTLSEGDKYSRKVRCPEPSCKKHQVKHVLLSNLPVEAANPEEFGVTETEPGVFSVKLLDDYGVMRFRMLTLGDAKEKAALAQRYPKLKATMELIQPIIDIDAAEPVPAVIAKWPTSVRNHMRAAMDSAISGVNLELENECSDPECRHVWTANLELDLSRFFFKRETAGSSPEKTSSDESRPCLDSGLTLNSWLNAGAGRLIKSTVSADPSVVTTLAS